MMESFFRMVMDIIYLLKMKVKNDVLYNTKTNKYINKI